MLGGGGGYCFSLCSTKPVGPLSSSAGQSTKNVPRLPWGRPWRPQHRLGATRGQSLVYAGKLWGVWRSLLALWEDVKAQVSM